ncbi:MAG: hypothetical protein QW412_02925 [Candidatus Aenigmatarchaeota archaeon]
MSLHRRWPPSKGYKVRREYTILSKKPYCTIEEITNAMGWNYFGGIQAYGVLQELNNWNVIRKWLLYLWKPYLVKEFTGEFNTRVCDGSGYILSLRLES